MATKWYQVPTICPFFRHLQPVFITSHQLYVAFQRVLLRLPPCHWLKTDRNPSLLPPSPLPRRRRRFLLRHELRRLRLGVPPPNGSSSSSSAPHSLSLPSTQARAVVEGATLKLEQFQRQVLAIKRASTASGAVDEDLHDRIRFACLLQEEIAKALARVPADAANSLIKRKLCKDFEAISSQLETAVLRVSAREQEQQQALVAQQQDGRIVAEHQGQVIEFAELENEIAHNEALIEEREQDINKIHQSVAQVNEIFRDLAAIVQDQQGAIDDIETHVHESMQQTQQGLDEVKKASDMQGYCTLQ